MGLSARPVHAIYFSIHKWFKELFSDGNLNNSAAYVVYGVFTTVASDAVITSMDMSWNVVVSHLAALGDDGPSKALKLFNLVTRHVRQFLDPDLVFLIMTSYTA
ncbi:hypothetical protein FNV43_RR24497 [Rhamnella rubrinervis]|uniref:Uncharacterized protein n=1 Tax=Rhamnella rubrinervis TaxID=2594499 RepID=A0A8K0DT69_9ROSA|nr:hypothetical protein FNV43_RR24497 [Rhamnella rubrinervis]